MAAASHRKPAFYSGSSAVISFTFDDFPRSAWSSGGTILREFGVRATYYASLGLMGTTTPVGEMFNADDLKDVVAAGHEVACHTHDHLLCRGVNESRLLENCVENRNRAASMIAGCQLQNFSFPEGVVTTSAKAVLSHLYNSCRTIEPGINRPPIDLAFLRANPVYSRHSITTLKQIIKMNQSQNGWLIFYTHDISPEPSRWGCTPEQFHSVVAAAKDSDTKILPIKDALTHLMGSGPE